MKKEHLHVSQSPALKGSTRLSGAKNAVLGIMASLILTRGTSQLENVPDSADVRHMITLLTDLGAEISFDSMTKKMTVETTNINHYNVNPEIMSKMRASILVMGPLLARFGKARVAFPGGCVLGARPLDYHLMGFKKMGSTIKEEGHFLSAELTTNKKISQNPRIVFHYPSVGATENILMLATLYPGQTTIVNAALEPEVLDLIDVLKKMGAKITIQPGQTIVIEGVCKLNSITHEIVPDRLEAGTLLLAAAITGGSISIENAQPDHMDVFLETLRNMGHQVVTQFNSELEDFPGVTLVATTNPKATSFKTGPYPGFPTDLQAPTMAALCCADGKSFVEETVFENRLVHTHELIKMGAQIQLHNRTATIHGVDELYGTEVIASDIRAAASLACAGLKAHGNTTITGINHWKRGYDRLEHKLAALGAPIKLHDFNIAELKKPLTQTYRM